MTDTDMSDMPRFLYQYDMLVKEWTVELIQAYTGDRNQEWKSVLKYTYIRHFISTKLHARPF